VDVPRPRLRQVVLDSTDARRSAEFWRELLGLAYRPGHEPPSAGDDDPAGRDWLNLRAVDGTAYIAIQQVEQLSESTWPAHDVPQQLHLDLSVPDKEWGPAERGMRMGSSSAVTRSARRASRLTAPPTQVIDPAKESRSDKTKLEWATNI